MNINLEWFFKVPGLFITIGIVLIIVALIVYLIGSKNEKEVDNQSYDVSNAGNDDFNSGSVSQVAIPEQPVSNNIGVVQTPINPTLNSINVQTPVVENKVETVSSPVEVGVANPMDNVNNNMVNSQSSVNLADISPVSVPANDNGALNPTITPVTVAVPTPETTIEPVTPIVPVSPVESAPVASSEPVAVATPVTPVVQASTESIPVNPVPTVDANALTPTIEESITPVVPEAIAPAESQEAPVNPIDVGATEEITMIQPNIEKKEENIEEI